MCLRHLCAFLVFASFGSTLSAQMVTGSDMTDFGKSLGLEPDRISRSYTIQELSFTIAGHSGPNVLWPGEQYDLKLLFINKSNHPIHASGSIEVIHFGTKSKPGDIWTPVVFPIGRVAHTELHLDMQPGAQQTVDVSPRIPETFGGYALVADFGPEGRSLAATLVRTLKPDQGRVQFPTYALDLTWDEFMNENVLALFEKLGIKGARTGAGFSLRGTGAAATDRYLNWAQKHNVTVMLTLANEDAPMPLGRPRPWLSPDGHMLETKDDRAWLPQYDDAFSGWVAKLVSQYGWPRGPVNAVELWNEPWEGISISGWGADIPRYRAIYEHMAHGVERARAAAGAQVLIGGACSSTNTRDKLFPDGNDKFLKWLDFVSIHYQPLSADPALVPEWRNRKGPYGRVKVWDTESWIANSEDRIAGVLASMRAQGQDRTAGVYEGNVYSSKNVKLGKEIYGVVQAWPPAAALAATQKFIGQRSFREILFKNGLPWIFVFDGLHSKDDGTLVIVGDLGAIYDPGRTLFRNVKPKPDAALQISAGRGKFALYDFYGNRVAAARNQITVPLNGLGYFLRSNGTPGSFEQLLSAVRAARIEGYDPVDIAVRDFTAPLGEHPALRVTLTNVLNRPVNGRLRLTSTDLRFPNAFDTIRLEPNQTRELEIPVANSTPNNANTYPIAVQFEASTGEHVEHREDIHANVIAKRTVKVDGDFSDWAGVLPQIARGAAIPQSLTRQAWLPFEKLDLQSQQGLAAAYLAYDEVNFYFSAKIADNTPEPGMLRFATRDDDAFFYPDHVWDGARELTWPAGVRRFSYRKNFEIPSGNNHDNVQIAFNVLPPDKKGFLEYPNGTMRHFEVYADTDYEYAFNPVAPAYGGGGEVWRLLAPGMPRKHFFPRQPKAPRDGGAVNAAQICWRRDHDTLFVEAALPWSEIPDAKQKLDRGETIKFTFRVNNNSGPALELATGRSVSKQNALTFHDDWETHWSNELEFGFEK